MSRSARWVVWGAAAGAGLVGSGCTATHVVYVHSATLGIDVTASQQGTGKIVLGFDREVYGIVPRYTPDGADEGNAMAVLGVSRVEAIGLREVQFGHVVVTGKPALGVAQDPEALRTLAERMFKVEPQRADAEMAGDLKRDGGGS